jgi:light-regulated signal transduction histidine kinase (bacteriophytochrome)
MGRIAMQEEHVALDDLLKESMRALELVTHGRRITWKLASLPTVVGDSAMLRQVLSNLLGNAVKYTRQRDPAEIEIGCSGDEDDRAIVFVRDNGAGFDMQYADKLFGVFQRLHRADEFEGTGIGLATVRRVVSRHGGRVWAEGAVGRGATFYFTMRRAAAMAAKAELS